MLAVTRFSKLLLLSGCLSVAGCACVTTSIDSELAEMVADVANLYAADARLSVWEVKVNETSDGWTIEGKTDRKEALDELNSRLHAKKMPVGVRVTVLPQDNAQIGDKPWALVNVSVATVKKEPRFAVAATTQALAGTPLRLLEFKAPFWRVQMPDGYIGWVHRLQIARMSEQELSDWNASQRVVVTARSTTLTNENGTVLAPLTAGSILRLIEKQGKRVWVQLPDGNSGFLRTIDVREANTYFTFYDRVRREDPRTFVRHLLGNAKKLLGTPYLWGGTSTNGVDCSGFVSLVWRLNGVILSRDADQQIAQAEKLVVRSVEDIPAGSLVAFGKKNEAGDNIVRHIGIALENGDFIHSLGAVRIESLSPNSPIYSAYFAERFLGVYTIDLSLQDVPNAEALSENAFYQVPAHEISVAKPNRYFP